MSKQQQQQHSNNNINLIQYVKTTWGTESPSNVVTKIAQGDRLATEALGLSSNINYRAQVVQAGGIDKILEFLLKTDKPFADVLPPPSENNNNNNNNNNNDATTNNIQQQQQQQQIPCPSIWINVLNNFCADGYLQPQSLARNVQYKIIVNLGPLVQDMTNMEQRQLFVSKDVWIKSLPFFTNMLYNLLSSDYERISDFLLKQTLLPQFLVRTLCLPLSDTKIVQEIQHFSSTRDDRIPKPDILGTAATFCACAMKTLWTKQNGNGGNSNTTTTTIIETYAGMEIAPEHELRLMTALLPLLQVKSHGTGWYQGGYSATLTLFLILFDKAERLSGPFGVDSASEIMVQICRHHLAQYASMPRDRFFLENIITGLVTIGATLMTPNMGDKQAPVDYNVAKAIRAGLLEYFIECCDVNDPRISTTLQGSIRTIGVTIILDETQKTLQELAPIIRAKMERILDRHPVLLPPLESLKELLDNPMIKEGSSIKEDGDDEDHTCAFCQEKTTASETEHKCPFCKTIVYCSKDCQRLNWMIHQMDCAVKRKEPVAQTQEQLMEDGKKCFSWHISKILLQAALKGISILDCIVVIDMCEYTPVFTTYSLEQFSSSYIQDEDAIALSEKVMKRNKDNGALTVSFVGFSDTEGFNGNLMTFPPDTAPKMPAVDQASNAEKWRVAQKEVARSALGQGGAGAQMQKNPRLWQGALMKTMKP